ncbi:amidase family protein [Ralstonia nicotianae]|uniref:amidase family protein n=1 Tax=Ralstonia pseudosolanacearum TaxID=1310165 RepID=UPI002004AF9A|nr:amidase family protein [Ralstonia pseudosolanacearum]MCK4120517.1 hypothetical protein [Ralstonia pseudosolanacearum]
MNDAELVSMTAVQVLVAVSRGELRLVDYVGALLKHAERLSQLNAFRAIDAESLLSSAEEKDLQWAAGVPLDILHGLPVSVKDSVNTSALPTANGTGLLQTHRPKRDAAIVSRMLALGGLLFGKTNIHELSFGWTCCSEAYGNVLNPYDPDRIPGGSSGGSAVAVAAGIAPLAIAEDTLGSLRIPASMCGVAGYRPCYGRYPNSGVMPLTKARFDQVGVIARGMEDILLWDRALTGEQPSSFKNAIAGARIAVCPDYCFALADSEVANVCYEALYRLQAAGAKLIWLNLPDALSAIASVVTTIILYECVDSMSTFFRDEGIEHAFSAIVGRMWADTKTMVERLLSGSGRPSTDAYHRALREADGMARALVAFMDANSIDFMAFPSTLIAAPLLADVQKQALSENGLPFEATMTHNTSIATCSGFGAVVLHAGCTAAGMPVGMEFIAPPGRDANLLAFCRRAETYMERSPAINPMRWHSSQPPSDGA